MSELIDTRQNERDFRRQLLATVSALALTAFISIHDAKADESADRPVVWIELGGQLDRIEDGQEAFAPSFFSLAAPGVVAPMVDAQKQPSHSVGENGKITFEPTGSDWLVSASVRYGRASSVKHLHYETARQTVPVTLLGVIRTGFRENELGDGQGGTRESHLVVDFQAGKDVGLGLFGAKGTSVFSAGVRFAQFTAGSDVTLHACPTYVSTVRAHPGKYTFRYHHFHTNTAIIHSRRSTRAIGPAVSWDASQPVVGDSASMAVAFDWGVNAAFLFGRQRAQTHHQTAGYYFRGLIAANPSYHTTYVNPPVDKTRARTVTIPNVGGFAGVSFRYASAKVSFGYRGDFFFNAMDTGWNTQKSSTVGFYGPFASVSIGLGG
jgi:iron complex outermembrane receptor protein